jgi:hypothetical protein
MLEIYEDRVSGGVYAAPIGSLRRMHAEIASMLSDSEPIPSLRPLPTVITPHDIESYEIAEGLAPALNQTAGETRYIACAYENQHPRYEVIELPKVGDVVSRGFNGDYYPDGTIVRINASKRVITTSTGKRYWRYKLTSTWLEGGMWGLTAGYHNERNPHL